MTFTAQEIKTIEDLQKISTVKPFGLWSEPIQNLFKDVGPQNCLVFESLKTWVRPKSHETRFDSSPISSQSRSQSRSVST